MNRMHLDLLVADPDYGFLTVGRRAAAVAVNLTPHADGGSALSR
jgi:hypothetical protein